ncbi:MAG: hypothetical protein ACREFB_02760 [Stellaceae bacterium]
MIRINPAAWGKEHMRRLSYRLTAAGLAVAGILFAGAAFADPDATIPAKASAQIVADLAHADLDALATDAGKYMGASASQRVKNNFASVKDLGPSQYTDLVYSRDYGQTEKDIIYKVDFEKAFAFVRFLWHVDNGQWRLIHLAYKTENALPFPEGWEHIYPK